MSKYTIYKCDFCGKETRSGIEYNDIPNRGASYLKRALWRAGMRNITTLCPDCHYKLEDGVMKIIKDLKEGS